MPKYRVVVEAEQFDAEAPEKDWPEGVYGDIDSGTCYAIDTLEGWHEVTHLDWIITGIVGEKYPCKPDIFEKTYEKVEE